MADMGGRAMLTRLSSADVIAFKPKPRPERFIRFAYSLYDSSAFQALHPDPRALYLDMARKFNGFNNGSIAYSNRQACQRLHIHPMQACRAFRALEQLGLIACTKRGSLKTRKSSEWKLTGFE